MSERTYSEVMDDFRQHIGVNEYVATDPEDVYAIEAGIDKRFADELDAAHKREITILRDALAEVVASIEVRFPVIEYALDRKPYLDAKKILEQYKEETK